MGQLALGEAELANCELRELVDPSGLCNLCPWTWVAAAGGWAVEHAGDISLGAGAAARILAAMGPEMGPAAAAAQGLSVVAGLVAAGDHVREGQYINAIFDALGTSLSGVALAERGSVALFENAAEAVMGGGRGFARYVRANADALRLAQRLDYAADGLALAGFSYQYLESIRQRLDPANVTRPIVDPWTVPHYPNYDPAPAC